MSQFIDTYRTAGLGRDTDSMYNPPFDLYEFEELRGQQQAEQGKTQAKKMIGRQLSVMKQSREFNTVSGSGGTIGKPTAKFYFAKK